MSADVSSINYFPFARRGPTGILLVHGLTGTPMELYYVARRLETEGYTVYCPVLDGHGGGTKTLRASRWQDWYTSVEAAYEKLRMACETVIVGGASAGGILALLLAARRPDQVSGLLLYAPTVYHDGWAIPRRFQLFNLITHRWLARYFHFPDVEPYGIKDERVRNLLVAAIHAGTIGAKPMIGYPGTTVLEFRWMSREARRLMGKVRAPTLIIHPRYDDFSRLRGAQLIQRQLGGSRVEMLVLNDSYHLVTIDRQRDLVVDRTLRFVRSLNIRQTCCLEEFPLLA